jgi:hypothetical protein
VKESEKEGKKLTFLVEAGALTGISACFEDEATAFELEGAAFPASAALPASVAAAAAIKARSAFDLRPRFLPVYSLPSPPAAVVEAAAALLVEVEVEAGAVETIPCSRS